MLGLFEVCLRIRIINCWFETLTGHTTKQIKTESALEPVHSSITLLLSGSVVKGINNKLADNLGNIFTRQQIDKLVVVTKIGKLWN